MAISTGKIKSLIISVLKERVRWLDVWIEGLYKKHDSVWDEGWQMIANRDTTERAGPIKLGAEAWIFPTTPAWITDSAIGNTFTGQFYTFTESGWISQIRVWAPEIVAGVTYRVVIIREPNALVPIVTVIDNVNLNANAWKVVTTGRGIVRVGSEALIYLDAINSAGDTIVSGEWSFAGTAAAQLPLSGEWNKNTGNTILRINILDLAPADRSAELATIIAGSTIFFEQISATSKFIEYRVNANPVLDADAWIYDVTITNEGDGGPDRDEPCTMTASIPISQATKFVKIDNYWPANSPSYANVDGFYRLDGVDQPNAQTTGYGVDIKFQRATISDHWDLQAKTETAADQAKDVFGVSSLQTKNIESLSPTTTGKNYELNPVTKLDQSVNIEAGNYLIHIGFQARSSVTNRSIVVGIFINDVLVDTEFRMEPKDVLDNPYPMKIIPMTFESGFHNFRVDFGKAGGSGASVVVLSHVRILIVPTNNEV